MTDNYPDHILIFPPLEYFGSVQLALPTLSAQLLNAGYKTKVFDFNIDFFVSVLNKDYLLSSLKEIETIFTTLKEQKEEVKSFIKDSIDGEFFNQKIQNFEKFFEKKYIFEKVPNHIEEAIKILKTEQFYDKKKYKKAYYIIQLAMYIVSLKYSPINVKNAFYVNYTQYLTYEYVKKIVLDPNYNIFYDYYKDKINFIKEYNPKLVGISISYPSQILAGLTLAYLIKKNTKSHVTIGGSLFTRKFDFLKQNSEFFDIFADSIIWGEGEKSIVELAEYVNGKKELDDVSNLIYKKNGNVVLNKTGSSFCFNKTVVPSFVDYDFDKYFAPCIVLPIEIQRSCYWGKCSFCDINYAKSISRKSIQNVIHEIKEYIEKYGISNFVIIDSATTPSFLNDFSDAIIANHLEIRFSTDARLEKQFTYKLLKKAYSAGLRSIGWGIESTVQRVSLLMNKKYNIKEGLEIIKNADKAGIWNNIYMIVGFPSETKEEAIQNVNFIKKHRKIIHSACVSKFGLYKYTHIYENKNDYGLEDVDNILTLNMDVPFKKTTGMSNQEIYEIVEMFNNNRKFLYEDCIHNCSYSQWSQYLFRYSLKEVKQLYKKRQIKYKISFIRKFFGRE